MTDLFSTPWVVATHNAGKVRELEGLMAPLGLTLLWAGALGLPEPEETGTTFAENALLKAQAAMKATGHTALADDSGLCVRALDNAPGVYSANWAMVGDGKVRDFHVAMARVQHELGGKTDRHAYFTTTLALVTPDGMTEFFEGRVNGTLVWPPRGTNGFGYDPIFCPEGHDQTFAEMDSVMKAALSHRAMALHKLVVYLAARKK